MRKQTVTLLAILLSLFVPGLACAREQTIVLGTDDGWGSTSHTDRLVRIRGRQGHDDLALMPFRNEIDPDTELLLHFDELPLADISGRFAVQAPSAELSTTTRRSGRAGLLVDGPTDVVTVVPAGSELFQAGAEWGSFTLEFWIYPVTLSQGERILEWEGREGEHLNFRSQRLIAEIRNRTLRFSFTNFFVPPDGAAHEVVLEGDTGLIPRTWSHHQIRFSAETARLEYLVNGRTSAVTHISDTGREDGTVYFPRIAAMPSGAIRLVPSFTGAIDEFRLVRRFEQDPALYRFHPRGGVYESGVIDLGSPGARLTSISAVVDTPAMTDVLVYVRVSDTRSGNSAVTGEWVPVDPEEPFQPSVGRFVQIRAELLPDFRTTLSPVLSEVHIAYVPDPPPRPPVGLVAIPGDGRVELNWAPVMQEDIRGYLVYYGEQPGRYFGMNSDRGASPIDVGQATTVTLSGLENGTLYYFAVCAYDAAGLNSATELSREEAARPARVHR